MMTAPWKFPRINEADSTPAGLDIDCIVDYLKAPASSCPPLQNNLSLLLLEAGQVQSAKEDVCVGNGATVDFFFFFLSRVL